MWLPRDGEFGKDGDHVAAFHEGEHGSGVVDSRVDAWLEACAAAFGFDAACEDGSTMLGDLGLRGKIGPWDGVAAGEVMRRGEHHDEWRREELGGSETLVTSCTPGQVVDHGHVEVTEADGFEALLAFEVLYLDQQVGEPLAQSCENPGDDQADDARERCDAQAAGGLRLQGMESRSGLVEGLEDPLAVIREYLACCRQLHPAAGSLDELDAGFALERGQLLRYGGRREPERVGDGSDTAAVCELAQNPQARDVEDDVLGHRPDYRRGCPHDDSAALMRRSQ